MYNIIPVRISTNNDKVVAFTAHIGNRTFRSRCYKCWWKEFTHETYIHTLFCMFQGCATYYLVTFKGITDNSGVNNLVYFIGPLRIGISPKVYPIRLFQKQYSRYYQLLLHLCSKPAQISLSSTINNLKQGNQEQIESSITC